MGSILEIDWLSMERSECDPSQLGKERCSELKIVRLPPEGRLSSASSKGHASGSALGEEDISPPEGRLSSANSKGHASGSALGKECRFKRMFPSRTCLRSSRQVYRAFSQNTLVHAGPFTRSTHVSQDTLVHAGPFTRSTHVWSRHVGPCGSFHTVDADNLDVPKFIGRISGHNSFDSAFFGINKKQCDDMNSMIRNVLERSYEAIVDAGLSQEDVSNTRMGVMIGSNISESENTKSALIKPPTLVVIPNCDLGLNRLRHSKCSLLVTFVAGHRSRGSIGRGYVRKGVPATWVLRWAVGWSPGNFSRGGRKAKVPAKGSRGGT
uniref:Beta-ketoacyl synthase-like N-terminal domain-containing protein n=1 Tax=Timema douglasi TaxID=61478 RepID=A0A7R8ZDW5_TIMDO|nr:unnamed protein product [Timema douglasi]